MTPDQFANAAGTLTIEGVDSSGEATKAEFKVCKSLPTAAAVALSRDLVDLGKRNLTPHHRVRPQLQSLAAEAQALRNAGDGEGAAQLLADRSEILRNLTDGLISGRADDLAADEYFVAGRRSIEGLIREIVERVKHAGGETTAAELVSIITTGNAGKVLASLQLALGEFVDPLAVTSAG